MNLADGFAPFVVPFAPACPDDSVLHNVRLATIEFFRRTHVWEADLTPITADGVLTLFPLTLPTDSVVDKLQRVRVQPTDQEPRKIAVFENKEGQEQADSGFACDPFAFTDVSRRALNVWPLQLAATSIFVRASLKPSLAALTLPDDLFEQYAEVISHGALSKLLAIPEKPWTNASAAGLYGIKFESVIATSARIAERGFAQSTRRSTTKFF